MTDSCENGEVRVPFIAREIIDQLRKKECGPWIKIVMLSRLGRVWQKEVSLNHGTYNESNSFHCIICSVPCS
jgi:hypothetical protein